MQHFLEVLQRLKKTSIKLTNLTLDLSLEVRVIFGVYIMPLITFICKKAVIFGIFIDQKIWQPQRTKIIVKYRILQKWDKWKYRTQARTAGFSLMALLIFGSVFQNALIAAPDLSDAWDLNNSADYTYSSGIEMTSGLARLKAQNYADDSNTKALYHFDESGGTNIDDSSAFANDATLFGGSFTTGNLNNAVTLDGVDDTVTVPNTINNQLGQQQSIEAWTKFSTAFNSTSHASKNSVVDKGDYQLYFDNETGKLTYELNNSNATTWTQVAGDDINGSWDRDGNLTIDSSLVIGADLYVGLGSGTGDAEVWRWNGTRWDEIGGDNLNDGWTNGTYESVYSMATDGTNLFAGLGNTAGDAEVWQWNGSTWTKIGGDAINTSWAVSTYEFVYSMSYFSGNLYAGLGASGNDAEVWRWNGSTWTKIGGDSLNSGWTTNFELVASLTNDGTNLYAGLGNSTGDAEVWQWNGSAWTRIGGDAINSSWANTTYENVLSMTHFGGILYAGLGSSANDAEVWSYNGTTWTQIGGDTLNSSWGAGYEGVYSLSNDGTNLYAGLGSNSRRKRSLALEWSCLESNRW
jgi:hypothetical protein